jgi:Glucose-6-phosphate dehydrogenase, C-terminal domain
VLPPPGNYFRFRVTPDFLIAVGARVKTPGDQLEGKPIELVISDEPDPSELGAYGELLLDAMRGHSARFARQDYVEQAWRIVEPVLGDGMPLYEYEPGTWGPPQAQALIEADGPTLRPADSPGHPVRDSPTPPGGHGDWVQYPRPLSRQMSRATIRRRSWERTPSTTTISPPRSTW